MQIKVKKSDVMTALNQAIKIPDDVWQDAGQVFRQETPEKTGNARRRTSTTKTQIRADYAYAAVLDAGRGFRDGQMRGSEDAPEGMTKPTLEYIDREIQRRLAQAFKG